MALFDEMPRIEGERLVLREMVLADAGALEELCADEAVWRYLPTFLYELRFADKREAIERLRELQFDTREAILLAVAPRGDEARMMGIAEVYAYEERRPKASIGCRLLERHWGHGVGTEVARLLKGYLLREGVRTITSHVMAANRGSARAMEKAGLTLLYPGCWEDWGHDEPVLVDKWVYKRRWGDAGPSADELAAARAATRSAVEPPSGRSGQPTR